MRTILPLITPVLIEGWSRRSTRKESVMTSTWRTSTTQLDDNCRSVSRRTKAVVSEPAASASLSAALATVNANCVEGACAPPVWSDATARLACELRNDANMMAVGARQLQR